MEARSAPSGKRLILQLFPRCVHTVGAAPGRDGEGVRSPRLNLPAVWYSAIRAVPVIDVDFLLQYAFC